MGNGIRNEVEGVTGGLSGNYGGLVWVYQRGSEEVLSLPSEEVIDI